MCQGRFASTSYARRMTTPNSYAARMKRTRALGATTQKDPLPSAPGANRGQGGTSTMGWSALARIGTTGHHGGPWATMEIANERAEQAADQ